MSIQKDLPHSRFNDGCAKVAATAQTATITTPDPDELLTSHVTAALIGIKNNTLEIWRCAGKGPPFIKLGDAPQAPVRYRRGDVIAFIEQRLYASTSHYTAALSVLRPNVNQSGGASK